MHASPRVYVIFVVFLAFHSFSVTTYTLQGQGGVWWVAEANPSWHWAKVGYTMESRHIDIQKQTTIHDPIHTLGQFRVNSACLWTVRKPVHPEKTHADMGRTCKLHTERFYPNRVSNLRTFLMLDKRTWTWTQDLLAVRHPPCCLSYWLEDRGDPILNLSF